MATLSLEALEAFALARTDADRAAALGRYVPGSDEHFLLAWLLAEHKGYPADLEPQLQAYLSRNPHSWLTERFQDRKRLLAPSAAAVEGKDGEETVPEVRCC